MEIDALLLKFWHAVFTVGMMANYWLETTGLNAVGLAHDANELVLAFIFGDDHVSR